MNKLKTIGSKVAATSVLWATSAQIALADHEAGHTETTDCVPGGNTGIKEGAECARPDGVNPTLFGNDGIFSTIATTLIFIVGAVSVIYLIIGGLRYVISNGDATAVKSAKDTILYAIIGIVVAVLAYALVQFVIGQFTPATTS